MAEIYNPGPETAELESIIQDPKRLVIGKENINEKYSKDHQNRILHYADLLALPINADEISALLAWANRHHVPVTPRGAGTNLTGSTVPGYGGLVIDLSLMNRILDFDEETLTLRVQPGVLLEDIQNYVSSIGYFYPPDPGEKKSSIGGNIATNAGGMRAVKYGVTRDYVRSLDVVLADGTLTRLGSETIKNASGLNLKEALIGSEGTLGIIAEASLKILPAPKTSLSVLASFDNLKDAALSVQKILQSSLNPTAIEFMNREVVKIGEEFLDTQYPDSEAGSYLLLTFDGAKNQVEDEIRSFKQLAGKQKARDVFVLNDPDYSSEIWKVRGALCTAVESKSIQEPIDIVVPINRIAEFIDFTEQLEKESGLQMVSFGHAGDGNIHLCIVKGDLSDEEWEKRLSFALNKLYDHAYTCHGLASGEHGIGLQKRSYFLNHTDPANLLLMNSIKDAFDPFHILNEGKSYVRELSQA